MNQPNPPSPETTSQDLKQILFDQVISLDPQAVQAVLPANAKLATQLQDQSSRQNTPRS